MLCVKKILIPNYSCGQNMKVVLNGPGDQGSILGQVRPKSQKVALDTSLLKHSAL